MPCTGQSTSGASLAGVLPVKADVMPQMIDAVLFDLDETITDRSASLARYAALFHREFAGYLHPIDVKKIEATFLALDNRGYRPREDVYAGIVDTLSWACAPTKAVVSEHWRMWCPRSAIGRAGLHETLTALTEAGIRVGVVTNGSESSQSVKIEQLGIGHYFSTVVISEVVQCEKPDPRIFQRALEQIGCAAGNTMFVGDHPINDVLGAAAVGLVPVWFEGVHAWPQSHPIPERRIRSLPDIRRFFSSSDGNAA
jgi:putative hydrolase of the HAD superfamily